MTDRLPDLSCEQQLYRSNRDEWSDQGHLGKYVVIKGSDVVGFFTSANDAYAAVVEKYGDVPFFMQCVLPSDVVDATWFGRVS